MKVVNLVQGTPEWHAHRAAHDNASDAPAMMNCSPYISRNEFIKQVATGFKSEVDAATQSRFNDGHRYEALARPLAEKIIGDDLYPVIGTEGRLSASFDGLTMDYSIAFEHKTLNDDIRDCNSSLALRLDYRVQMEQQLTVSGAKKCLFVATKFDKDGTLLEDKHFWYEPDYSLRAKIIAGWEQFRDDVANYQEKNIVEMPAAAVEVEFPALFVQATGMVTATNLPEFKRLITDYVASVNLVPATDQEFSDGDASAKKMRDAAKKVMAKKDDMLAQTASIGEVAREMDAIAKLLNEAALKLEKAVKDEKESRKLKIARDAELAFAEHCKRLAAEISPVCLLTPLPRFADEMKGLKKLSAMHNAVDSALSAGIAAANAEAADIRVKLAWCKDNAAGQSALFPDLQQIITKPMADFTLLITSRIKEAAEREQARIDAETVRIRAEEEAKARAKVEDENKKIIESAQSLVAETTKQGGIISELSAAAQTKSAQAVPAAPAKAADDVPSVIMDCTPPPAPSRAQLVDAVSSIFIVSKDEALSWLVKEFAK